jgi:hypothetical protein
MDASRTGSTRAPGSVVHSELKFGGHCVGGAGRVVGQSEHTQVPPCVATCAHDRCLLVGDADAVRERSRDYGQAGGRRDEGHTGHQDDHPAGTDPGRGDALIRPGHQ